MWPVVAQLLDVFKTRPAGKDIVDDVQHMIRFPVRRAALEQNDVLTNRLSKPILRTSVIPRYNAKEEVEICGCGLASSTSTNG